jgi:hypothetical protein
MRKFKYQNILAFCTIPIAVYSILPYLNSIGGGISFINITAIWWVIISYLLYVFYQYKRYVFKKEFANDFRIVQLFLGYNVLQVLRGFFVAESYWDWKTLLTNAMSLCMPIIAYTMCNPNALQIIFRNYLKYTLPLFLFISFLITADAFGFYLAPIGFLVLFLPFIKGKWKYIIALTAIIVITADLAARSNVIKFLVPFAFLLIYYFRHIVPVPVLELFRKILLIVPFILFYLGVTGTFNVFKMDEYIEGDYTEIRYDKEGVAIEDDLTADTRTPIYVEVLQSAVKHDYVFFGRSPARGNDTEYFADLKFITGRQERASNEVAILNVITWTGAIGVILYFFVFYRASSLALNHSNNIFSKIVGLYIAFRWAYAWAEDINIFSMTYFMIWIALGFCFSRPFRQMSNRDIKDWISGVYRNVWFKY